MIPNDPIILLSYVNTKLRDYNLTLDAFCDKFTVDKKDIIEKLKNVGYDYVEEINQFR